MKNPRFHYTYRLRAVNSTDERVEYIGVRSCRCLPAEDAEYMSSSREVKAAISDGVIFTKEIIAQWVTRAEAAVHEIELHNEFDVGRNPRFFNLAKHKSTGFDVTGIPQRDEHKAKIRAAQLAARKKPEVIAKHAATNSSPEFKARKSASVKAIHARPDVKEKHAKSISSARLRPEVNQRIRMIVKDLHADANFRRKHLAGMNRPDVKAKMRAAKLGTTLSDEHKNRIKRAHQDPTVKEKLRSSLRRANGLRRKYCELFGITRPGKSYCNIDPVSFKRWLATETQHA